MNVTRIDHIVLTVRDIDVAIRFYASVLGMAPENFAGGRYALKFGDQKINLHRQDREFEPKADRPVPGSADLCFITETAPEAAMDHVRAAGAEIIEGPVRRTGALGPMISFYFRDPDGNLIEVARYESI